MKVRKMVEKPKPGTAPSSFATYGRYLYTPELFEALRATDHSHQHQGEFTQTEAINLLAQQGKVSAVEMVGERFDVGEPLGYLTSMLRMAMQRPELREALKEEMQNLLAQDSSASKSR
jgi:UTP--glucose-1-phosphate uridylyltransferase